MDRKIIDSKQFTINNGLQIVSVKKDTSLFSINAAVKIGSIYENDKEKGIAHFVEHMLFKGTGKRNNEELNNELENIGGEYNAYTDYNCTVINVNALKNELENAAELISDMLINSNFNEKEMVKEKDVILAEIRASNDDVEDYSFKKANEAAYKNSPLKNDITGTQGNVKKITRDKILNFYNRYYIPNNCCIVVVSSLEHEDVYNIINKYFSMWKKAELKKNEILIEKNINKKVITYKENIEQCSVIYIFNFYNMDKKRELALRILNHKFGESANSILFREVREKRGLAYDIYSELDTTDFVKSLYIYTAVSADNVDKTIACIRKCINRIKNEEYLFDLNSVNLMKKVLKTAVISTIEDVESLCSYVLHQTVEKKDIYEFLDDLENLQEIKREDIYESAREVFQNPTVHILLPKESGIIGK
ncbi:MAG: pitrilysin family protein [Clostridium sp.]|nr:pitrilysin family protein [Clostridium sp.]